MGLFDYEVMTTHPDVVFHHLSEVIMGPLPQVSIIGMSWFEVLQFFFNLKPRTPPFSHDIAGRQLQHIVAHDVLLARGEVETQLLLLFVDVLQ